MQSLRDKLLKAGLVSEDAAKKAEADKAKKPQTAAPAPQRASSRPPPAQHHRREEAPAAPRIPKLPPLQGSKEAHRLQAKKQVQLDRQMRELVLANTVPTDVGATPFYFVTRKNKLRRLEITQEQARKLEAGELAVVERPDPDKIEHALVLPAIAEQLLALSPRAVRFLNKEGAKVGFLSDAEISARASEADVPETPDAPQAAASATEAAPEPAKPSEPETFITVKRAPRE